MPITDLLVRNAKEYGDEVALIEINPDTMDSQRRTWKEYSLIETNPHDTGRKEMTWKDFDVRANRFANFLLTRGIRQADRLHRAATAYVSAAAQARIIRSIFDSLPEEDQSQVKRWRNHKYHSKAKNADPMTYKWATAFEALIGYLHLTGDAQRLEELLEKAAAIIEEG